MTDQEFADAVFEKAKDMGLTITSHGNLECPHQKNISKDKLKKLHTKYGSNSPNASSEDLQKSGIESCCFNLFRKLAKVIYP